MMDVPKVEFPELLVEEAQHAAVTAIYRRGWQHGYEKAQCEALECIHASQIRGTLDPMRTPAGAQEMPQPTEPEKE